MIKDKCLIISLYIVHVCLHVTCNIYCTYYKKLYTIILQYLSAEEAFGACNIPLSRTICSLSQMGDKAVKQPSIYVIKCLCPIVMHLENDLPPTAPHSVINLKITTGKTVWDLIHFPAEMTPEGKEVDFHLQ